MGSIEMIPSIKYKQENYYSYH